jgi:tetratricopeptide (TPR) repeat protein
MKNKSFIAILFLLFSTIVFSQSIEELFVEKKYSEVIKYSSSKNLTKEEYFFIGYSYFQMDEDKKAIKMYDLAIKNGLQESYIYMCKGISYRFSNHFDKAIDALRIAIQKDPTEPDNHTEMAYVFKAKNKSDSALVYFYNAKNLYEEKDDVKYSDILKNIGQLEYQQKNFTKSVNAYSEILTLNPYDYEYYSKAIKAYYANEEYSKGDSLFTFVRSKRDSNELPNNMMEVRGLIVDEFLWNDQIVRVMKYYKKPEKFAEPIYQFFILNKQGDKTVYKILTEKTSFEIEGTKHLLCGINSATGDHTTFPIGWKTDDIDYVELKKYVFKILDGKLTPSASSSLGSKKKREKGK